MYRHEANFQVDGMVSGLRTKELVESSAKRFEGPLREAQRQYDTLINQIDCYQRLGERIRDLQDITNFTPDASALVPATVRTGDPEIKGSAEAGAVMGQYTLSVGALAGATRLYSEAWEVQLNPQYETDPTAPQYLPTQPLAAGTLTVALNSGETKTQPLGNGVDQTAVATGIIEMGLSISAQILSDTAHSPPRQSMMFSGLTLGQAAGFTLTANYDAPAAPGTLSLDFSATVGQIASDSQVTIDGRPDTVTSSTRTVVGALPGVTLTLGDGVLLTSPPTATFLSIEMDGSFMRSRAQHFLDVYNALMAEFARVRRPPLTQESSKNPVEARERRDARKKALAGRAAEDDRKDREESNAVALLKGLLGQEEDKPLPGIENLERDPWVRNLQEQMARAIGNPVKGVDTYGTLAEIGVGVKKNALSGMAKSGEQVIDDAVFDAAVATRPLAVAQLFAGNLSPTISGVFQFIQAILVPPPEDDPVNPGKKLTSDSVQIQLFRTINSCQALAFTARHSMRAEYERLQGYKARQMQQFANLEKMKGNMQVTTDYLTQVAESMKNRQP